MKLRRASAEDAGKLALLGGASLLETFANDHPGDALVHHAQTQHSAGFYETLLDEPDYVAWIVEEALGAPVGYAVLGPAALPGSDPDTDIELKRIYMLSKWHGTGFGRALFDEVEAEARARGATRLLLSVYTENHKAQRFYAARGFEVIGRTTFADFPAEIQDFVMAKPF